MGEPAQRLDDDDDRPPRGGGNAHDRPDWLVTPDEGARSETTRQSEAGPSSAEPVRLLRPSDPESDLPLEPTSVVRPVITNRPPPRPPAEPAPAKPTAWTAAAPSVPTLKVESAQEGIAAAPPPPAPPADDEAEKPSRMSLSSFDDEPAAAAAPAPPRPRPLHEPWWIVALDALRSERRVQLIALGVVVLVVAWLTLWPRAEGGVSLATLRRNPARWDSQRVKVHGRIGDVFPLGGGYAFYLMQGGDTIVVFTRAGQPETNKTTDVVGTVSTGFLDGVPRQSIFEEP